MSLSKKLYSSRHTILEMLQDRGIDISNYENFSQEELEIMFNKVEGKPSAELSPIDMIFPESKTVVKYVKKILRVKEIRGFVQEMLDEAPFEGEWNLIVILFNNLKTEEELELFYENILKTSGIFVQMFSIDKLTFNVTKHELVPKHELITEEEKDTLMKRYNLESEDQLPIIKKTDPVAKYLGLKAGQVCRIIRRSETYGSYINYRLCEL
jgi:DNA-directed RNA polymerase I, II, and III subunit RPABC1